MIDFRMETFMLVCETMNYTRAAEQLHITQPAVSQHIKYIEQYYNERLFTYRGKQLKLTKAGELLYYATMTLRSDESYLKKMMHKEQERTYKVRFGASLTIGEFSIPKRFQQIVNIYPHASMDIIIDNTFVLLDKLNKNEIEFALIEGGFDKLLYDYKPFSNERFIAVCGIDYTLKKDCSRLSDLVDETLLIRESGSGSRNILESSLVSANMNVSDFRKVITLNSITAIKQLCIQNQGITFLYETAVKEELKSGVLIEITLQDFVVYHDFNFIWSKGSMYAKEYGKILDIL